MTPPRVNLSRPDIDRPLALSEMLGPIALGAAPLGNLYARVADDEAVAVVRAAFDAGIRYFDTAPHYGNGLSEHRVGRALRDMPRSDYALSSKIGRLLIPDENAPATRTATSACSRSASATTTPTTGRDARSTTACSGSAYRGSTSSTSTTSTVPRTATRKPSAFATR
ncbi:MAG: aldo/keto reductase [Betaproteobacteria bacterium]|nr:MAG: aldo/keto reductase [Betaproteobacteria bacterium]